LRLGERKQEPGEAVGVVARDAVFQQQVYAQGGKWFLEYVKELNSDSLSAV
jgi:hypothetical protein